jgi:hypothetical protein
MQSMLRFARVCASTLACLLFTTTARAEPQNGWWWNPNESGRGFFIEMRGGVLYLAGYFYESDGRATWMTSGGPVTDPYLYNGTLQTYGGGQTLFGDYRPPAAALDIGPVSVRFDDDAHATIAWPGGTIPIQREIFDGNVATFQPHTGWWWNPAQSGRGFSVEVQGNSAFIVAFMYDVSGNPVWYFSAGPMSSPTHFESDWLQFAGGQTMSGPYHPPAAPQNVGRLAVDFSGKESATLTFTGPAASAKTGAKGGPKIIVVGQPQLQAQTVTSSQEKWPYYEGFLHRVGNQIVNGYNQRIEHLYYDVQWDLTSEGPACPTCDPSAGGVSAGGVYTLHPDAKVKVTFDANGSGCTAHGEAEFPVTQGRLEINGDLTYQGIIGDENAGLMDISVELQCGGGGTSFNVPVKLSEIFHDGGTGIANFYPHNAARRSYNPHIHAESGLRPLPGGTFEIEAWFRAVY